MSGAGPRTILSLFFLAVLAAMLWATITASLDRNVLQAAAEIWADPWGRATLLDAYFAFLVVYLWILHREPSWGSRLGWLMALLLLGNFAIAVYFLLALRRLPPAASWRNLFEPSAKQRSSLQPREEGED